MSILGKFKKNSQKSDPKCLFCKYGRPANSEGKILCEKCGIVSVDYCCKKFSPSKNISENNTQIQVIDPDDSNISASEKNTIYSQKNNNENAKFNSLNDDNICYDNPNKEKTSPESEELILSNINCSVTDNSEKIKGLLHAESIKINEIENKTIKKKVILPELSEVHVTTIQRKAIKNNENNTIITKAPLISDIHSSVTVKRTLPENTLKRRLSNIK